MSETGVAVALGILAAIKELRIAYFRFLEVAEITEEQRTELRKKFMDVDIKSIPRPERLKE